MNKQFNKGITHICKEARIGVKMLAVEGLQVHSVIKINF